MIRVFFAAVGLYLALNSPAFAFNYCSQSDKVSYFFVDMTTPFDKVDQTRLAMALDKISETLEAGETLIVRTIDETARDSSQVFKACMPRCAEQGILEQCNVTRARVERSRFNVTLGKAIQTLQEEQYQRRMSPILMTLVEHVRPDGTLNHVFIYSDMIENSDILPFRQEGYLEALRSTMAKLDSLGAEAQLDGASVMIFGFGQFHDLQRTSLSTFFRLELAQAWDNYLKKAGARDVTIGQEL
jgi:hypothetical protein